MLYNTGILYGGAVFLLDIIYSSFLLLCSLAWDSWIILLFFSVMASSSSLLRDNNGRRSNVGGTGCTTTITTTTSLDTWSHHLCCPSVDKKLEMPSSGGCDTVSQHSPQGSLRHHSQRSSSKHSTFPGFPTRGGSTFSTLSNPLSRNSKVPDYCKLTL